MLTAITTHCRRLHTIVQQCWLRFRLADIEYAAVHLEADMLAAPAQLIALRGRITDLRNRLRALEDQR
ncbi:MAG: hypothetical protein EOP38_15405 [Rubrivivax sp.]|nr:MAG: hypothetical protein EOP38_15405 [Rubrivivax sp.]